VEAQKPSVIMRKGTFTQQNKKIKNCIKD